MISSFGNNHDGSLSNTGETGGLCRQAGMDGTAVFWCLRRLTRKTPLLAVRARNAKPKIPWAGLRPPLIARHLSACRTCGRAATTPPDLPSRDRATGHSSCRPFTSSGTECAKDV